MALHKIKGSFGSFDIDVFKPIASKVSPRLAVYDALGAVLAFYVYSDASATNYDVMPLRWKSIINLRSPFDLLDTIDWQKSWDWALNESQGKISLDKVKKLLEARGCYSYIVNGEEYIDVSFVMMAVVSGAPCTGNAQFYLSDINTCIGFLKQRSEIFAEESNRKAKSCTPYDIYKAVS